MAHCASLRRNQDRGVSRQFGYVDFESSGDAEKALEHMEGAQVCPNESSFAFAMPVDVSTGCNGSQIDGQVITVQNVLPLR